MALEFFTRSTQVLGSLLETICKVNNIDDADTTFERLPDCVIMNIFSRLAQHSFLRCRWVCRHWRALVTSHDSFTNIHHLSTDSRPMFLIRDDFAKHGQHLFIFGENKKKKKAAFEKLHLRPELIINKNSADEPILLYSCQGVVMFGSSMCKSTYYVVNPITQEEVIVRHTLHPGFICALYFCPYTRQFRILYAQVRGTSCQYFVYIFKMRKWRKVLSSTSFNFLSTGYNNPAVVNGALHWIMHQDLERKDITPCENGIMIFRMDKEEFSTMPHPTSSSVCNSKQAHLTMTLMVKDDRLFFFNLCIPQYTVDMWILEDYETRSWIKRYKINLFDERIFPFTSRLMEIEASRIGNSSRQITLLYFQGGQLLIHLKNDYELYLYDLDHRTVKKLELPRQKMLLHTRCNLYNKSFLSIA